MPDAKEPFSALAFKIMTDPFVGRLAFFRAYSGHLDSGSYVLNTRTGKNERISSIMQMHANKQNPVDFIEAGDIGAAVGFKDIKTGDTLCDENNPIVLESMTFPEPVISVAVEPKTQADVDKMGMAIAKLVEEDPTLRVRTDEETGQTILSGMGELHLEIIVDRMKREFKVEINQGAPQVAYKEAFQKTIEHREILKKQTGGRGKFADIVFEIGPADEEFLKEGKGNFQFVNGLFGGSIPKEFVPAIQKGFESAMTTGVLAAYPMESMKVRVFDGSFHQVDSDSMSFELCAKAGFREAAKKAKACLLEPIMKVEVLTPDQYMGDVTGDLIRRRGILEGMDSKHGVQVIKAKVPLSEMFGYVTQLRSLSSGRATSTMEFSHYAPAPNNIAEEVIVPGAQEWVNDLPNDANRKFVRDFRVKYQHGPSFYGAQSYDAANLVNSAVTVVKGDLTRKDAMRAQEQRHLRVRARRVQVRQQPFPDPEFLSAGGQEGGRRRLDLRRPRPSSSRTKTSFTTAAR